MRNPFYQSHEVHNKSTRNSHAIHKKFIRNQKEIYWTGNSSGNLICCFSFLFPYLTSPDDFLLHSPSFNACPHFASAGNPARVTSMATMYSTTRPLMLWKGSAYWFWKIMNALRPEFLSFLQIGIKQRSKISCWFSVGLCAPQNKNKAGIEPPTRRSCGLR